MCDFVCGTMQCSAKKFYRRGQIFHGFLILWDSAIIPIKKGVQWLSGRVLD